MKLFVLISSSMAQDLFGSNFAAPDLSSFGLPSFGGDLFSNFNAPTFNAAPVAPAAPAEVVAAAGNSFTGPDADDTRYFSRTTTSPVTTSPTTTMTTPGEVCWHCDAESFSDCATMGYYKTCSAGEHDCCFVELRETKDKLQTICTGCKAYQACYDLKKQNFVWSDSMGITDHEAPLDQCRPVHNRLQSRGRFRGQQSVCRTCFRQCRINDDNEDGKGAMCFGGLQENGGDLSLAFPPTPPAMAAIWQMDSMDVLGIPTWGVFDNTADTALVTCVATSDANCAAATSAAATYADFTHVYFGKSTTPNGKTYDPTFNDGDRKVFNEMTYWQIQNQPKRWWQTNLKWEQMNYYAKFAITP
jgi:hypothetical protein